MPNSKSIISFVITNAQLSLLLNFKDVKKAAVIKLLKVAKSGLKGYKVRSNNVRGKF